MKMMNMNGWAQRAFSLALIVLGGALASAGNWPQFRGPNANPAVPDNPALPDTWSASENVDWVIDVPGLGWSSPVVWGDKVFLTTVAAPGDWERPKSGLYNGKGRSEPVDEYHAWIAYCFDLNSGEELWERQVHHGKPATPRHPKNTYASETPVTDGERVYFLFGDLGLFVFDMDGNEVWKREIDAQKTRNDWGPASSPILHEGRVILLYDNLEVSWIESLDAKTGETIWHRERDEDWSWATPYIWKNALRSEIVTNAQNRVRSYDLDGKLLWEFDGRMSWACIATPFADDNFLFVNSGYFQDKHRPVYAVRPGASGDISLGEGETSNEYIAWYHPTAGNYNTSPLLYKGLYYSLLDRGSFECYDPATGEQIFSQKRINENGRATFTSSPWAYNGKIFCLSEQGETYVLEAGREFKLSHVNDLGEMAMSTPAILDDSILIRTTSKLYRIKK